MNNYIYLNYQTINAVGKIDCENLNIDFAFDIMKKIYFNEDISKYDHGGYYIYHKIFEYIGPGLIASYNQVYGFFIIKRIIDIDFNMLFDYYDKQDLGHADLEAFVDLRKNYKKYIDETIIRDIIE